MISLMSILPARVYMVSRLQGMGRLNTVLALCVCVCLGGECRKAAVATCSALSVPRPSYSRTQQMQLLPLLLGPRATLGPLSLMVKEGFY